jgi:hypothetical protein
MSDKVLPVGQFSPAPGILIDRTDRSTTISGTMELYGPEASAARASSIERSINTTWTQNFSDGYSISCKIVVRYRPEGSKPGNATQIEADKIRGPSHVTMMPGFDRTMTLNANEPDAFTWTSAHEFGHIIGLKDRYSEPILSKIRGRFGGDRENTTQPGYERNLMGAAFGKLESQNLADLAEENAPSPYWVNDDTSIRKWMSSRSTAEIGKRPTRDKIKMIHVLMGGWISDDDMNAIARICESVTTPADAKEIQKSVDLLDFSSLGQRTRMRIIFSNMPGGWVGV